MRSTSVIYDYVLTKPPRKIPETNEWQVEVGVRFGQIGRRPGTTK